MLAFAIDRQTLIRELSLLCRVVEKKSTIPILLNVEFRSHGNDRLKLTATDLEIGITTVLTPLKLAQSGAITLPAKALLSALKKLASASVAFLEQEGHKVVLVSDKAKVMLNGLATESFPELPQPKTGPALAISSAELMRMIARTAFAISSDESRFTLNGALIEANGSTRLIATDGHRLSLATVDTKARTGIRALIPVGALRLLPAMLSKGEFTLVSQDDDHLYFTELDRQLICRKLKGNFPEYERVMPQDYKFSATVNREALYEIVDRAKLFSDERSRAIRFAFTQNRLEVSASTVDGGDFNEGIRVDYSGDALEIGFNADYVLDFLRTDIGENIEITMQDQKSSWLFKPVASDGMEYKYVLMPMRI